MNAKKAKIARRIAREASVGLPADGYVVLKTKLVTVQSAPGKFRQEKRVIVGVDPKTTKGIYRKIKKDIKRAYRN